MLALAFLGVVLLFANGAFVGAEFALVASRRTRLEQAAGAGDRLAVLALRHSERLPRTLAALQLGISTASIGLGFTTEAAVEAALTPAADALLPETTWLAEAAAAGVGLAAVVSLHTLLGEMVPKNLAIAAPETSARWLAPSTSAAAWLFRPLVPAVTEGARLLLAVMHVEPRGQHDVAHTADEIVAMLETSRAEGAIREYDERLMSRIVAFSRTSAEEAMVPWSRLETVPEAATLSELETAFTRTRRGRLPLRARDGQRIVGYIKSCDLGAVAGGREARIPRSVVRETAEVRQSDPLVQVLQTMRRAGRHFAVVRGQDGSTLGIVTMRQVIEALIGP